MSNKGREFIFAGVRNQHRLCLLRIQKMLEHLRCFLYYAPLFCGWL